MESTAAQDLLSSKSLNTDDVPKILEAFKNSPYPTGILKVLWYPAFENYLKQSLRDFISDGSISPQDVISELNHKIFELRISIRPLSIGPELNHEKHKVHN